jgi:predicted RNA-binding protein with PIN domain
LSLRWRTFKVAVRILIDGYNLTGVLHKDLEAARRTLLDALIGYNKKRGHDITVVFDGWGGGSHMETRTAQGGIKIIFSKVAEKADAVIKRILAKKNSAGLVLVTNDRDLVRAAWARDAVPVPSEEFIKRISLIRENTGRDFPEDSDFEEESITRAGRSRTLSKKEKAVERALAKL